MLRHYNTTVKSLLLLVTRRNHICTTQRNYADLPKSSHKENPDDPIKFFGSQAAEWRARDTRHGGAEDVLWYQPYVVSASLALFLLYFCVLREESDIDRKLEGNLFDQVSGLEEVQLIINYKYNRDNGLDTKLFEKRLNELGVDVKKL